ncbi:Hypothetical predicted protein [Octopus vulgaris]|uniref:Uncharacterized protein n=1 Tax=Octopus vulgaris TaxID=6645 RepID=A0AA36FMF5_OCTVU|nr:Hypothetical predicted protein [Octopus vulgaris]
MSRWTNDKCTVLLANYAPAECGSRYVMYYTIAYTYDKQASHLEVLLVKKDIPPDILNSPWRIALVRFFHTYSPPPAHSHNLHNVSHSLSTSQNPDAAAFPYFLLFFNIRLSASQISKHFFFTPVFTCLTCWM